MDSLSASAIALSDKGVCIISDHGPNRSKPSQLDCFPGPSRFVNSHHNPQIPQPFFARRQWLLVTGHALGHVIHFQGEMIALATVALFDRASLPAAHSQSGVARRGFELRPAFRTDDADAILTGETVARRALRERARWEPQLKIDRVFDFFESRVAAVGEFHRVHLGWLFARRVT